MKNGHEIQHHAEICRETENEGGESDFLYHKVLATCFRRIYRKEGGMREIILYLLQCIYNYDDDSGHNIILAIYHTS